MSSRYPYVYEKVARLIRAAAVGHPCPTCGVIMIRSRYTPNAVTADHRVPLALGGTHDPSNLWARCRRCNCTAGASMGGRVIAQKKRAGVYRLRPGAKKRRRVPVSTSKSW